jgi:hypothetical protein
MNQQRKKAYRLPGGAIKIRQTVGLRILERVGGDAQKAIVSRPNTSSAILHIGRFAYLQTVFHLQAFWNGICKLADARMVSHTVTPLDIATAGFP